MKSLYSRLYTYRQRRERAPLEDFLTEAFADLFDRLDSNARTSLLEMLLPKTIGRTIVPDPKALVLRTQVTIGDDAKRPDMVLSVDERDLAVIEVKVDARYQMHAESDAAELGADLARTRHQLDTYARWIAARNRDCPDWPGAVVLMTAFTDPPEHFLEARNDFVQTSVRRWKNVADWIATTESIDIDDSDNTASALAGAFYAFLQEQQLMTKYATSKDFAAAMLFTPSYDALEATFDETMRDITTHAPRLCAGRQVHTDFWAEQNIYCAWILFAKALRRRPTLPYIALGICFEISDYWDSYRSQLPPDEPFFFLLCTDDKERETASQFLERIPEGWVDIEEIWTTIICRPVSAFPADPDKRVAELQTWAKVQIDKLVACVPKYAEAPAGRVADPDADED